MFYLYYIHPIINWSLTRKKGTWQTLTWLNRPCLLRNICFLEVQHLRGLRVRVVILKWVAAGTSPWGSHQASHIPSAAAGALVVCLWGTLSSPLREHFSHFSLELLSRRATSLFPLSSSPTPRPICSVFLHPFPPHTIWLFLACPEFRLASLHKFPQSNLGPLDRLTTASC